MKTIRLLTIGNSFAENALRFLEEIADGTGEVSFDVGRANLGGCSLQRHWNLSEYTREHPDFKTYRIGAGPDGTEVRGSLQDALALKLWDKVTVQQASWLGYLPETFEPYLGQLVGRVRQLAPQAEVLMQQTWAYRSDSPHLPSNGLTQDQMHERIAEVYRRHAKQYALTTIPSGEAVAMVRRTPGKGFTWPDPNYDYFAAKCPALPDQSKSLAAGWYWDITGPADGIPVRKLDANHLNDRGCYLIGLVWLEVLSGTDCRQTSFTPDGITAADAAFLKDIAHQAAGLSQ